MPSEYSPIKQSKPLWKETAKTRILYFILFCISFVAGWLLLNSVYRILKIQHDKYLFPERCYIAALLQFPLKAETTGNFFDDIDTAIEVREKNLQFRRHQKIRSETYIFEPLVVVLIIYITTTFFSIVFYLIHFCKLKCWAFFNIVSGFQSALFALFCFTFIKIWEANYCEQAFWIN